MTSSIEWVAGIIGVTVALASFVCSLLTLYIIKSMGKWSSSLQLICSLTVCQIFYDSSLFFIYPEESLFYINEFLSFFGGISTALWTNVMITQVYLIIHTLSPVKWEDHYPVQLVVCVGLGLAFGVCSVVTLRFDSSVRNAFGDVYNAVRLASIVYNILLYLLASWQLRRLVHSSAKGAVYSPLKVMITRLKYYPLVQVVARVWPTYHEISFGLRLSYQAPVIASTFQKVAVCLFYVFMPSAGIGYFLVFLAIQPRAFPVFVNILLSWLGYLFPQWAYACRRKGLCYCCCCCCCCCCHSIARKSSSHGGIDLPEESLASNSLAGRSVFGWSESDAETSRRSVESSSHGPAEGPTTDESKDVPNPISLTTSVVDQQRQLRSVVDVDYFELDDEELSAVICDRVLSLRTDALVSTTLRENFNSFFSGSSSNSSASQGVSQSSQSAAASVSTSASASLGSSGRWSGRSRQSHLEGSSGRSKGWGQKSSARDGEAAFDAPIEL